MRRYLLIITLLAGLLFTTAWTQRPQQTLWEYKFEYEIREKKANELGVQGWELVAISPTSGTSSVTEYVFKRPK